MILPLWPPCAVRSCMCFVPVRGQKCAACVVRAKRLDRQMAQIAELLMVERAWYIGTFAEPQRALDRALARDER